MQELIDKIERYVETTQECMDNTNLPQYVINLLNADMELFKEIVETLKKNKNG